MQNATSLTPEQKREQTQMLFVVATAGSCMVLSAVFPFFVYLALSGAAFTLFLSLKQWTDRANLTEPPTALVLDHASKTIAGVIVGLFGIFLLQMSPLSQIIICSTFGASLAAFFIHECILSAQLKADNALRGACQDGDLEKIKALLALKASPFSPDNVGNNAFHLSLHTNQADDILKALHDASLQAPLTFIDVAANAKHLFNEEILETWRAWAVQIKQCIRENTKENRVLFYEASFKVMMSYYAPLQNIVNKGAAYLTEQLSYPKNILATNKAGQSPLDILTANASHFNADKLVILKKHLNDLVPRPETPAENTPSNVLKFSTVTGNGNGNKNDLGPRPIPLRKNKMK